MNRASLNGFGIVALTAVCGLLATGCGGEDNETPTPAEVVEHIEIAGTWGNADFGETDAIDDASWSSEFPGADPTVSTIAEFSNKERFAVRLSPDDAPYHPGTYDYTLWTALDGDSFYTCTGTFGCATAAEAEGGDDDDTNGVCDASTADETDLEHGCGGYSWTKLTKQK